MDASSASPAVVGIDIGGTFTDFMLLSHGKLSIHKRLTTALDPSQALLAGIEELGVPDLAGVVHGSTIATNALLERRGARTALITTRGFADVLEIGRQDRPNLYELTPRKPEPLVPAALRFEVDERITAEGRVLVPLSAEALQQVVTRVRDAGVESVAIVLLFSFLDASHEQQVAQALGDGLSVSLSSEILPEYREYERTSTTVINAYVAPLMERYLARVEAGLGQRRLRIMQSNGGVITSETARREAARTVLSGPAGGAVGAFQVAHQAGYTHIISFDMGGTSTDVALFPGAMIRTRESKIGGLPLRLPVVDIHTVGAGGGSLARVDAGGALQVGPESAGADPGPACYGRDTRAGREAHATTSDANLLLGRLHPDRFLGGQMPLYPERARSALSELAVQMGVDQPEQAAWGVLQIANATMVRAIRAISVERGYDPREFTLVPFGGAGPLHACELAEALGIPRIFIPLTPGVLSALGMILADLVKDYSRSVLGGKLMPDSAGLGTIFTSLEDRARRDLAHEGIAAENIVLEPALDMRYRGQSHEITVEAAPDGDWLAAFHAAHGQRYGHRHDDEPVEIVNARLKAIGMGPKPHLESVPEGGPSAAAARIGEGSVWFGPSGPTPTPLYERDKLRAGNRMAGPAVIYQLDTTIVIAPGWQAAVDAWGNIVLEA